MPGVPAVSRNWPIEAASHTHRHRGDIVGDPLHGVVDRHSAGDRATRGVDVQVDVSLGILGVEQQHLGAQRVGILVLDLGPEEDDAVAQQRLVDVVGHPGTAGLGAGHGGHALGSDRSVVVHDSEPTLWERQFQGLSPSAVLDEVGMLLIRVILKALSRSGGDESIGPPGARVVVDEGRLDEQRTR